MRTFFLLMMMFLSTTWIGCGPANKITVKGVVKNNGGGLVADAEIRINDVSKCCSNDENPCVYKTDVSGNWKLYFNAGGYSEGAEDTYETCTYSVSKIGFATKSGSFKWCLQGKCAGEQAVSTEVALAP